MNNFKYVSKRQLSPVKQELIQIIKSVQDEISKDFTFRFDFVGSVKRNMVTYDVKSNILMSIYRLMMMNAYFQQNK